MRCSVVWDANGYASKNRDATNNTQGASSQKVSQWVWIVIHWYVYVWKKVNRCTGCTSINCFSESPPEEDTDNKSEGKQNLTEASGDDSRSKKKKLIVVAFITFIVSIIIIQSSGEKGLACPCDITDDYCLLFYNCSISNGKPRGLLGSSSSRLEAIQSS